MCGLELMSIDPLGICSRTGLMVLIVELTFRKQKLYSTEVTLAGGHHQQGPALLVAHVNISTMLQQLLCNLKTRPKTFSCEELTCISSFSRHHDDTVSATRLTKQTRMGWLTCQCPCLMAQNKGETPRRLTCCTTAPCSNRKLHTSIFPRPAAAVKAEEQRGGQTML